MDIKDLQKNAAGKDAPDNTAAVQGELGIGQGAPKDADLTPETAKNPPASPADSKATAAAGKDAPAKPGAKNMTEGEILKIISELRGAIAAGFGYLQAFEHARVDVSLAARLFAYDPTFKDFVKRKFPGVETDGQ
jgi:hypothetical protein